MKSWWSDINRLHLLFAAIVSTTLTVGLSTYYSGCNPNLQNQCTKFDIVQATAFDNMVTFRGCSECIEWSDGPRQRHCVKNRRFTCYSAFVEFQYPSSNQTCLLQTDKDDPSEQAAHDSLQMYGLGGKRTMIKKKGISDSVNSRGKCTELSKGLITWWVGVAILSLCALAVLLWTVFAFFDLRKFLNKDKAAPTAHASVVAQAVPVSDDGFEMYTVTTPLSHS